MVSSIFKMLGPEKLKISQLFSLDYIIDFGLDFQEIEAMILHQSAIGLKLRCGIVICTEALNDFG